MNFLKDLKIPFFTVIFIFLALFLYTKFAPPLPFLINDIQTVRSTTFDVDGTGTATVVPDIAYITFEITQTNDSLAVAQQQANARINKAIGALKQHGITDKEIRTVSYYVTPGLNGNGKGFTVNQQTAITVKPIEKINEIINVLDGYDVNVETSVMLGFSEELKKKILNQIRTDAVNDAKEKAQSLAKASGVKLGRIINVQETPPVFPDPINNNMINLDQNADQANQPTSVNPDQNTITTSVTVSYQTY